MGLVHHKGLRRIQTNSHPHLTLTFLLSEPAGICQSPMFNAEASTIRDCLRCFCFGITDQCVSSTLTKARIPLPADDPNFGLVDKRTRESLVGNFVQAIPSRREYVVSDYTRRVRGDYYWSLPKTFLGNRVSVLFFLVRSRT